MYTFVFKSLTEGEIVGKAYKMNLNFLFEAAWWIYAQIDAKVEKGIRNHNSE
jgi:hypothetical protein